MSPRVVLEPKAKDHDPNLYRADVLAEGITGFGNFDESALSFYRENGYLLVRGGLSSSEVEAAREELIRMIHSDDPGCDSIYYEGTIRERLTDLDDRKTSNSPDRDSLALGAQSDTLPDMPHEERAGYVRKVMGCLTEKFSEAHAPLAAVSGKQEMRDVIEGLSGRRMKLYQDMAMIKPPRGREKPWHQDHAYFNLPLETPIVAAWIALDEVSLDNGCMFLLAGGHHEGPRLHFMRRDWQLCDTDLAGVTQTAVPMHSGDVLLFDAKLPHGTPANRSNRHRWALQLHYIPVDVKETDDEQRLATFGSEGKNVTC